MAEKIAVIGSGISGLAAAYLLAQKYDVKIYEKHGHPGGHSNTVHIDYSGKKIAVDTAFMIFNKQAYPNFVKFLEFLKINYKKSDMSFAVTINGGKLEYAGNNIFSVFAQIKNLFDPAFLRMLFDIGNFNKKAQKILNKDFDPSYSLGDLLVDLKVKKYFCDFYLLPISSAIWSCPTKKILQYPAQTFVRSFKNNGLLGAKRKLQWYTVDGGSTQYVKKVTQNFPGKISLNDFVTVIKKTPNGKLLVQSEKSEEIFDKVVIATHGDQALQMLPDASREQLRVLINFKCQKNLVALHKDSSVMPKAKRAWASWVYSKDFLKGGLSSNQLSVTYWMNSLQGINKDYPLFVTLNPPDKINPKDIFATFVYEHPIFDAKAIIAQEGIEKIQGIDGIYFCGAYQKYGFHEDGLVSAMKVAEILGAEIPW